MRRTACGAFAVALLLAGLVAMHALTVGHEPVTTPVPAVTQDVMGVGHAELVGMAHAYRGTHPHEASAAVAAGTGSMPGASSPHVGMRLDEPTVSTPSIAQPDGCAGCGHDPGSHAGSHLFDICLAVLLAGAVTFQLVAALRRARPDVGSLVASGVRAVASGPTERPPSLPQLCVLRT